MDLSFTLHEITTRELQCERFVVPPTKQRCHASNVEELCTTQYMAGIRPVRQSTNPHTGLIPEGRPTAIDPLPPQGRPLLSWKMMKKASPRTARGPKRLTVIGREDNIFYLTPFVKIEHTMGFAGKVRAVRASSDPTNQIIINIVALVSPWELPSWPRTLAYH